MSLKNAIWEHLKTRRKYNTLKLKYNVLEEEYEKKVIEYNTEKAIHLKEKEIWQEALKKQEEKIIELRKRKANKKQ